MLCFITLFERVLQSHSAKGTKSVWLAGFCAAKARERRWPSGFCVAKAREALSHFRAPLFGKRNKPRLVLNICAICTLTAGLSFATGLSASAQTIQMGQTADLEYLKELGDRAKQKGNELGKTINPAKPSKPIGDLNIPALSQMLRDQPALRDMLNLEELHAELNQSKAPDYREYGVVMVSFSMPDQSLRELALQANRFGFTTVFRGLVNNSFQDTLARLTEVFGDDLEQMKGFSINPTAFTRFNVQAVPAYVFLGAELEPCTTRGCEGDPIPEHDIVYGNILFEDAAEIVVNGSGVGSFGARELLGHGGIAP